MAKADSHSVKEAIQDAFMELMAEKGYMEITVTDIINKAKVARASFYRNFNTTSDVIDAIVGEVADGFITDVFPVLNGSDPQRIREFLVSFFHRFTQQHKKLAAMDFHNRTVLFSRMDNMIYDRENKILDASVREKYAVCGKFGLINNIAKKWIMDGMKESPEELIDYIMSFILLF